MEVLLLSVTPEAEKVIERAARTCYMSQERISPDSCRGFIKKIIKAGHFSVLEHAYATFKLSGVSRSLTHQLVRHRLCSFSQKSQRYVSENNFSWVTPPSIEADKSIMEEYRNCMGFLQKAYLMLREKGVKAEDARFILPNGCATEIVFSANFRQLRHMISLRGSSRAQWEIRRVFTEIASIMKKIAPSCFYDFNIEGKEKVIHLKQREE